MKKVLPILLVAAMALPVWADVAVTTDVSVPGELTVTITPSGDAAIRGAALEFVRQTGDAVIDDAADVAVSGLNTNIDYFYTNGLGLVTGDTPNGEGHAAAKIDAAGAIDDSADNRLPAVDFAVSAGYLDAAGTQLGQTGPITIVITYTGTVDSEILIAENALRGGIVGDDLGTITFPAVNPVVTFGEPECIAPDHADYAQWELVGKPDSWCAPSQCYGDADGQKEQIGKPFFSVGYNDINILLAGFKQNYSDPITNPWIAADFDRQSEQIGKPFFRVGYNDINILLAYFKQATVPTDCND